MRLYGCIGLRGCAAGFRVMAKRIFAGLVFVACLQASAPVHAGVVVGSCTGQPAGTSCTDTDGIQCTFAQCNGAGICDQNVPAPAGVFCTDTSPGNCFAARCDGAGSCDQNSLILLSGSACTDTDGNACTEARCDSAGTGNCDQNARNLCGECAGEPLGTPCTDTDGNTCTIARCDALGNCNQNALNQPFREPCNTGSPECPDGICDGGSTCLAFSNSASCLDTDGNDCTRAGCLPDGHCDQNAIFLDGEPCPDTDNNACTRALCDDAGNCDQNANILSFGELCNTGSTECPDGICDGVSTCLAFSNSASCLDTDGNDCTRASCRPDGHCDQNANFLDGEPCPDTDGNACTIARCDGAGNCDQNAQDTCECAGQSAGTPCTDRDGNECTTATCDGSGDCNQNGVIRGGESCTDTDGNACTIARCDASGNCDQNAEVVCGECTGQPAGASCTDTDGNECTAATCDGAGNCDQNGIDRLGERCTDTDGNACTIATCKTGGFCSQSIDKAPAGTPCGPLGNECYSDVCDGNGQCGVFRIGEPCTDTDDNPCTIATCNPTFHGCAQDIEKAPAGTPCGPLGNECYSDVCNDLGECGVVRLGERCTDTDGNACTIATCKTGGFCSQSIDKAPAGTPCGPLGNECISDVCDGSGECGVVRVGARCTDTDGNACTRATCTPDAFCSQSRSSAPAGTPCGPVGNECISGVCDGLGQCDDTIQVGEPCTDTDGSECTIAGCDSTGTCDQRDQCNAIPPEITCPQDARVTCGSATDPSATGVATATDDCDPSPDIDHSDNVVPTNDPANPIQEVIERTWTATDDCSNHDDCVQNITVLKRVFSLDIKPGSCPNALDPQAHGVLPLSLLGTASFDVRTVNVNSLVLSRADGVGGTVKPTSSSLQDTGTPFGGQLCGCHTRTGDGIKDLSLKFDNTAVTRTLKLDSVASGKSVILVLSGTLSDGCEFVASDCMVRTAVRGK
ncbi:MAG: hypothetical protein HY287_14225 [Planctomycetes bacterium]|nr:hypothetical protein [Planctomycetota bacterium]MBI3835480.1 hypothetical protein [Planctomycetota bacterium]